MCDIKTSFGASPEPVQKTEALNTHTQRMNVMLKLKLKYNNILWVLILYFQSKYEPTLSDNFNEEYND